MNSELLISGRVQTRRAIEESMKAYLSTLDDTERWNDFFESSIGKTVINLLSGIGELLTFKAEVRGKEAYLPTARTQSAVYLLSQMLGYNPNRKKNATGKVTASIQPYANNDFIIPKDFSIDATYPLVIKDNIQVSSGDQIAEGIEVMQGEWVNLEFSLNNGNLQGKDWETLFIEEENFQADQFEIYIEVDGVPVYLRDRLVYLPEELTEYIGDLGPEESFKDKLNELYSNTVIVKTDYNGGIILMFGDGLYGKRLQSSNIVNIRYLRTLGAGIVLNKETDLGSYVIGEDLNANVVNFKVESKIQGGTNEDSLEKIKYLASWWFQTQFRAVTKFDYEAISLSYPGVISAKVKKIDDECCSICISALKADFTTWETIEWTDVDRQEFLDYLDNYKMLSTKVDFWEPEPAYLNLKIRVVIRPNTNTSQLDDEIRNTIRSYCWRLGGYFRTTKCCTQIFNINTRIMRVYIEDINSSTCYPDVQMPCYGYLIPGSISISFQVEYAAYIESTNTRN